MFKAKKWMLSRAADTKAGRSAVIKLIGESGDDIIQVLKSATTHIKDKATAKASKKDTIKIALKVAHLFQAKRLDRDGKELEELGGAIMDVAVIMAEALGAVGGGEGGGGGVGGAAGDGGGETKGGDGPRKSDAEAEAAAAAYTAAYVPCSESLRDDICQAVQRCKEVVLPLIAPLMKPANAAKFEGLCDLYGSREWLDFFLTQELCTGERVEMARALGVFRDEHPRFFSQESRFEGLEPKIRPGDITPGWDVTVPYGATDRGVGHFKTSRQETAAHAYNLACHELRGTAEPRNAAALFYLGARYELTGEERALVLERCAKIRDSFGPEADRPGVDRFLSDTWRSPCFLKFLAQRNLMKHVHFNNACHDFFEISNKGLMKKRANKIVSTYLNRSGEKDDIAGELEGDLVERVHTHKAEGTVQKSLMREVSAANLAHLEVVFPEYLTSAEYAEFQEEHYGHGGLAREVIRRKSMEGTQPTILSDAAGGGEKSAE